MNADFLSGILKCKPPKLGLVPKIQKETDLNFGGAQIVKGLLLKGRIDGPSGLEFQQYLVFDQQVGLEVTNLDAAEPYCNRNFPGHTQARGRKSMLHRPRVDLFQEAVT